ncbi:hypothetical protein MAP00_005707 [Monascus purpureus]|nr:hypothetical protein MAP00_005707 [Monascus purpureus]
MHLAAQSASDASAISSFGFAHRELLAFPESCIALHLCYAFVRALLVKTFFPSGRLPVSLCFVDALRKPPPSSSIFIIIINIIVVRRASASAVPLVIVFLASQNPSWSARISTWCHFHLI